MTHAINQQPMPHEAGDFSPNVSGRFASFEPVPNTSDCPKTKNYFLPQR